MITELIEINDAPLTQRNILVRSQSMQDISLKTSASLTQGGKYCNDEDLANRKEDAEIPLSIEVMETDSLPDKEEIKEEGDAMKDIINDTPLTDPRALSKQLALGEEWTNKKVFVEPEANPMPGVSLIDKLLGPSGSFLNYITSTTQARVELRGRGSQGTSYASMHGEKDADLGLHLDISARSKQGCEEAERLCKDLVAAVKDEYQNQKKGCEQQQATATSPLGAAMDPACMGPGEGGMPPVGLPPGGMMAGPRLPMMGGGMQMNLPRFIGMPGVTHPVLPAVVPVPSNVLAGAPASVPQATFSFGVTEKVLPEMPPVMSLLLLCVRIHIHTHTQRKRFKNHEQRQKEMRSMCALWSDRDVTQSHFAGSDSSCSLSS